MTPDDAPPGAPEHLEWLDLLGRAHFKIGVDRRAAVGGRGRHDGGGASFARQVCVELANQRRRGDTTVGAAGDAEPLLGLPKVAYPAEITVFRTVAAKATLSLRGNHYSVSPSLVGRAVQVGWPHGTDTAGFHAGGQLVAEHRLAPRGAQQPRGCLIASRR